MYEERRQYKRMRQAPKTWIVGWFITGAMISVIIQAMWEIVREERFAYEVDKLKEDRLFCPMYKCRDAQRRIAFLYDKLNLQYDPDAEILLPDLSNEEEQYQKTLHGGDHLHVGKTVIPIIQRRIQQRMAE